MIDIQMYDIIDWVIMNAIIITVASVLWLWLFPSFKRPMKIRDDD